MIESCDVCYITLRYFEDNEEILKIKKVILNNQILFETFQEKTFSIGIQDDIGIYIENFDDFFQKNLAKKLREDSILSMLEKENVLIDVYSNVLYNICHDEKIFDHVTYFITACKFYDYKKQENLDKIANSLMSHNDVDLFLNFLKDTELINTYNYFLKILIEYVKNNGIPYFETKEEIINYIIEQAKKSIQTSDDIPFFSKEEFRTLFLRFLNRIHAPIEWYHIFDGVNVDDNISNFEIKKSYYDRVQNKICIYATGGLDYFLAFVHEFGHAVTLGKTSPPFSLNEFSSIFYEKLAVRFLIEIGYDKTRVENIASFREKNNFEIFMEFNDIICDIYEYLKNGLIANKNKLERVKLEQQLLYLTTMSTIYDFAHLKSEEEREKYLRKLGYVFKSEEDYQNLVNEKILFNILFVLKDVSKAFRGYVYVIDSYMADKLLDKNETEFLDKMVNITDSLYQYDAFTLLHDLGLEDIFQEKRKDVKLHKRKKEE